MKIKILLLTLIFLSSDNIHSQQSQDGQIKRVAITESSIVKDSSGTIYSSEIWKKLLLTGYYKVKAENPNDKSTAFILIRLSEEQRERTLSNSTKPAESKFFTTGKEVQSFSTTDINGKKYKLKDLKGKIVVLNFWFINCPPCRLEILELNKLVQEYKDSSNILFLAIALDNKNELKLFLKSNPFNYTVIDSGRDIANEYGITSYPTHAVIDQQGRTYFHVTGTGSTTVYWLQKSIEELMKTKE